ncbi:chloroplast envelope membrane protein [Tanacetum coccineum]
MESYDRLGIRLFIWSTLYALCHLTINRLKDNDLLDAEEDIGDSGGGLSSDDEGLSEGSKGSGKIGFLMGRTVVVMGHRGIKSRVIMLLMIFIDLIPGRELAESAKDMVFGREEDEILYEDRVFRFSSFNLVPLCPSYLKMRIYNTVHVFRLKEDDLLDAKQEIGDSGGGGLSSDDEGLSEGERFEAWKKRAEAIVELREAQENVQNEEQMKWEDWLPDGMNGDSNGSSWYQEPRDNVVDDFIDFIPGICEG